MLNRSKEAKEEVEAKAKPGAERKVKEETEAKTKVNAEQKAGQG